MSGPGNRGTPPAVVALDMMAAITEGRIDDMVALTRPDVTWRSTVRPGLTLYQGHEGIRRYDADLRAAFGRFRVEVGTVAASDPARATLRLRVIRESDHGDLPPMPVTAVFTVVDGLVTAMEATLDEESSPSVS